MRERVVLCSSSAGNFRAHYAGKGATRGTTCLRCGRALGTTKRKQNARWMRERSRRYRAEGRCGQCGARPPLSSATMCARCHRRALDRQTARRRALKADARCVVCKRATSRGWAKCAACRADLRVKRRQVVREGCCLDCRKPSDRPGQTHCSSCARRRAASVRKAYHEGRIRVRGTPRGKQRPYPAWPVRPIAPPEPQRLVAGYVPPLGSIAYGFANAIARDVPTRREGGSRG